MKVARKAVIGVLLAAAALLAVAKVAEYRSRLAALPEGFGAWRIVHAREKVFGLGPGGNETGVLVYAMPARVAAAIESQGIAWLAALPATGRRGRPGITGDWRPTPVAPADARWADPAGCDFPGVQSAQSCPGIGLFLNRYGFGLPLAPRVEALVNDALFAPGAYWVHRAGGLLLVIPAQRRIVFAYAG